MATNLFCTTTVISKYGERLQVLPCYNKLNMYMVSTVSMGNFNRGAALQDIGTHGSFICIYRPLFFIFIMVSAEFF